jgi:shikimate 5-dehydrogenase
VNEGGVLTGLNTDYIAIQRIFTDREIPLEASIGVFGSGGMAKAITSALDDSGYRQVTIVARNENTGPTLANKYGYRWLPRWEIGDAFEVLVNASPLGMAPQGEACPWPEELIRQAGYVVDSVAIPVQTRLLQTASRLGKSTVSGFEIIVIQSLEQFKLYTDVTPDDATVRAAKEYMLGFGS